MLYGFMVCPTTSISLYSYIPTLTLSDLAEDEPSGEQSLGDL